MILSSITWLFHPLHGNGYQFWSGIEGSIPQLAAVTLAAAWLRKHNCHVQSCPRLQWHAHPDHGHPVCKHHHPDRVEAR